MEKFNDYYDNDKRSQEIINSITNRYLQSIFESDEKGKVSAEYDKLPLNDLNANLTILKDQLNLLKDFGIKQFPCLKIQDTEIPINIFQYLEDKDKRRSILPRSKRYFYGYYFPDEIYDFIREIEDEKNDLVLNVDTEFLYKNIKESLTSFLNIRHASFFDKNVIEKISTFFRKPPSITTNNNQYLTVTLNTGNHGLDISASAAYFINWKKFGCPTSPIEGYLMPGTYIFGGSGPGVPTFTSDPIPVDIPPNFRITLTKI